LKPAPGGFGIERIETLATGRGVDQGEGGGPVMIRLGGRAIR